MFAFRCTGALEIDEDMSRPWIGLQVGSEQTRRRRREMVLIAHVDRGSIGA